MLFSLPLPLLLSLSPLTLVAISFRVFFGAFLPLRKHWWILCKYSLDFFSICQCATACGKLYDQIIKCCFGQRDTDRISPRNVWMERGYWEQQQAQWTASCERVASCKNAKMQKRHKENCNNNLAESKKKKRKKPSNLLKLFRIFSFSTLLKIQIKRAKCANCCEWISMRVGASYDSTYPVKGRQCMPNAARVSLGWAHWFSLATIECAHKVLCILWAQMSSRTCNWQRITKAKG